MECSADTTPAAARVQIEAYRRLGEVGRFEAAFGLIALSRHAAVSGIRARHPEYDDEQVRLAYVRLVLGQEVAQAMWPDRHLPVP
jgi:hypothetical protein